MHGSTGRRSQVPVRASSWRMGSEGSVQRRSRASPSASRLPASRHWSSTTATMARARGSPAGWSTSLGSATTTARRSGSRASSGGSTRTGSRSGERRSAPGTCSAWRSAGDVPVTAAVIQNPFVDGRATTAATVRSQGLAATVRLGWTGLRDALQDRLGRAPLRVPLAGAPGSVALMTTPDAVAGYESIMPDDPTGFEPAVPARIALRLRSYRPARRAHRVRCPLLVCACVDDALSPAAAAAEVAARAPHGELRRYPIGHFELFGGRWFERVVEDQVDFLSRHLL